MSKIYEIAPNVIDLDLYVFQKEFSIQFSPEDVALCNSLDIVFEDWNDDRNN